MCAAYGTVRFHRDQYDRWRYVIATAHTNAA